MKLCIVIPALNEEKRIGKTLDAYMNFFRELEKKKILDFEIVIVLNACEDNTLDVVKKYAEKHKEIRYLSLDRKGKGLAIIRGFEDSLKRDNELIGFVDADMATLPDSFYELVKNADKGDCIIASRALKESKVDMNGLRKFTSRGFNFLVRSILLLHIYDTQCGAKIIKRNALENVIGEIGSTEWSFDVDFLYRLKKRGFKIKEVPTVWEGQGGSKLNLIKTPFRMFSGIMRLRILNSPFKFIVRAYDKLPEKIKLHHF